MVNCKSVMLVAVAVVVYFASNAHAEAKSGGYWCWMHQDGTLAACAPKEEQCKASLTGANQTFIALHEPAITGTCIWQKSAWQLVTKEPLPVPRYLPTKKLCTSGLQKGERCKQVR